MAAGGGRLKNSKQKIVMDSNLKKQIKDLLEKQKSIKKEIDEITQKDFESMERKAKLLNVEYKILLDIMELLISEDIEPLKENDTKTTNNG